MWPELEFFSWFVFSLRLLAKGKQDDKTLETLWSMILEGKESYSLVENMNTMNVYLPISPQKA